MTNWEQLNEEQIMKKLVEILDNTLINKFSYESIKTEDKTITKTIMKSSQGWTIENTDEWEE